MNYYQSRMERYSFINAGSTPSAIRHKGFGTGFVAGHNSWHHTAFAQYFDNIRKAKIKGVYLVSGKSVNYSDQTFSIHLWRDDNGLPGQTIASIENIAVSSLTNNAETLYNSKNPKTVKSQGFDLVGSIGLEPTTPCMSSPECIKLYTFICK